MPIPKDFSVDTAHTWKRSTPKKIQLDASQPTVDLVPYEEDTL